MKSRSNIISLLSGLLVAACLFYYMVSFTVGENEHALVFTFGRVSKVITEPVQKGQHWKWPWPIQNVVRFERRIRVLDASFEQIPLKDGTIIINTYLCWRISDPLAYWRSSESGGALSEAESFLRLVTRGKVSNAMQDESLRSLVSTDPKLHRLPVIEKEVLDGVKKEAERYGIEVVDFGVKGLALPESTIAAVFEHMRSKRQKRAADTENEGKTEASRITAEARKEAERIIAAAEREAKKIRSQGDAAAVKSYELLERNPKLARFLRSLQALKEVLKNTENTTLIVTDDMPIFSLLKEGYLGKEKPPGEKEEKKEKKEKE